MPPNDGTSIGSVPARALEPQKVVPLLSALGRVEDLTSTLAMRLDPVINHSEPQTAQERPINNTVTARLLNVGDALQYLLDNLEL